MEEKLSDKILLTQFKSGENEAFQQLLDRYEKPIIGYLFGLSGNIELSKDVCQETFIKLIHTPPKFYFGGSLKSWFFKLAKNLLIDCIRRESKMQPINEQDDSIEVAPNPYVALAIADDFKELHSIIDELKEEYRDILVMHFFSKLTFREISVTLNIPLGTVLWKMKKAISLMQEKYKNNENR